MLLSNSTSLGRREGARCSGGVPCYKQTPLHYAAKHRQAAAVECLIEKGANKEARDQMCSTPLKVSVQEKNNTAVIRALAAKGAKINLDWKRWEAGNTYHSPLYLAVSDGHVDAIEALIAVGADIDGEALGAAAKKNARIFDILVSAVRTSRHW